MKKNDIIPQYLQDELENLVKKKSSYTKEELEQLKRDHDHVLEQRKQLEEAEKYKALPEEEAAITNLVLLVKQYMIEETIRDAIRFLNQKLEENNNLIKKLRQSN